MGHVTHRLSPLIKHFFKIGSLTMKYSKLQVSLEIKVWHSHYILSICEQGMSCSLPEPSHVIQLSWPRGLENKPELWLSVLNNHKKWQKSSPLHDGNNKLYPAKVGVLFHKYEYYGNRERFFQKGVLFNYLCSTFLNFTFHSSSSLAKGVLKGYHLLWKIGINTIQLR